MEELGLGNLDTLTSAAADVVVAAALLGEHALLPIVAEVAELPPDEAIAALESLADAGLLEAGTLVALASSPLAAMVRERASDADLRRMHLRAARALRAAGAADIVVAHHLVLGAPAHDPWAVPVLREAARRNQAAGDPHAALRCLDRALAVTARGAEHAELLMDAARIESGVSASRAAARVRRALPLLDEPAARAAARLRLADNLVTEGRITEALDEIDVALAEYRADGDEVGVARAELAYVGAARLNMATRPLARHRLARLSSAPLPACSTARRVLLAELAYEEALAGTDRQLSAEHALLALGGPAMDGLHELPGAARHVALLSLIWAGQLEAVEQATALVKGRARRLASPVAIAAASQIAASVFLARGRLDEALAEVETVLASWDDGYQAVLPGTLAIKAACLLERGDVAGADAALALPGGEHSWAAVPSYHPHLLARAQVALAQGEDRRALDAAMLCGTLAAAMGTRNPAVLAWRSVAATAAAALGEPERARALAREELELARAFGAPRPIATALLSSARCSHDARQSRALLDEAVALLDDGVHRIDLARCLVELARRLDEPGEQMRRLELLGRAAAIAAASGARPLADAARAAAAYAPLPIRRRRATDLRPTAPEPMVLRMLGAFEVKAADGRVLTPGGLAAKAVKLVALSPKPLHVEELADQLWPEVAADRARPRVRNVLLRVRETAPGLLVRRGDLVALGPAVDVDGRQFDLAFEQAQHAADAHEPASLEHALEALRIYDGELLPSDPYADWVVPARERFRRRYLALVDLAARELASRGRVDHAIRLLESGIRHDPYDEERYVLAARICLTAGRSSAARAFLERGRTVTDELGVRRSVLAEALDRELA
jgi:DNA-binding SARP family transcriptional activator